MTQCTIIYSSRRHRMYTHEYNSRRDHESKSLISDHIKDYIRIIEKALEQKCSPILISWMMNQETREGF